MDRWELIRGVKGGYTKQPFGCCPSHAQKVRDEGGPKVAVAAL